MGNLQSRPDRIIEIYWGRERLTSHRISWFTARFPANSHFRPYVKANSLIRGHYSLDLATRGNDAAPWLTGWKGSYHDGPRYSSSLREAVELLLEDRVGSHNFNIGHLFQSGNRRGVDFPVRKFQDLIEALVNIGMTVGCLRGGSRPISDRLKSAYMDHRSFLKHNATISEAVRFLSIGHRLRSRPMIQDFMFTVLSGFDVAFPKSQAHAGASPHSGMQRRDYRDIDRDLWDYLKRHYNEYQHRKREKERQLRAYLADMGNNPDNSILLSVRPSALIDLVSLASTSVKSRPQPWEIQNPGRRGQVVVEVKTIGDNNHPHRAQRDPNRERERHRGRGQFEHALVQLMNQFAQEERERRYDNTPPWEVHSHGRCRGLERRFRRERCGPDFRGELGGRDI